jgi:16S rRNA (guanine527-N7)-methyltransferase
VSAPSPELYLPVIASLARAIGAPHVSAHADGLARYLDFVATWNRKINLTGAREPSALAEVMLADACVLASDSRIAQNASLIDVGTGAGAPIVPLLLLRPDLRALCIEPLQKRATFLRMLTARLSLIGRMRVDQRRLELNAPSASERADIAISRATFAPETWLSLGLQLAERVVVMTAGAEPPEPPAAGELETTIAYELPSSHSPRRIAIYRAKRG